MGFSKRFLVVLKFFFWVLASEILQKAEAKPLGTSKIYDRLSPPGNQTESISLTNWTTPINTPDIHIEERKPYNETQVDGFQETNSAVRHHDPSAVKPDKRAGDFEGPVNLPEGFYLADMIVECLSPLQISKTTTEDYARRDITSRYLRRGLVPVYPDWKINLDVDKGPIAVAFMEFLWREAGRCQECYCRAGEGTLNGTPLLDGARYGLMGNPGSKCPTLAFAAKCCMCKEFLFYRGDSNKGQRTGKLHFGYENSRYLRGPADSTLTPEQKELFGAAALFPKHESHQQGDSWGVQGEVFEDSQERPQKFFVPDTKEPYYLEGPEIEADEVGAPGHPSLNWLRNIDFQSSQFSKRKRAVETDPKDTVRDYSQKDTASISGSNSIEIAEADRPPDS
ncbi:hypothetical protein TWF506_001062 [Arthrobotrys conoides]|uniref:Uncharacterized protein n=1 Tax=Arthrobotrys conoides TaxID=74498 RepID=A0AAN8NSI4_9PEZI